MSWLARLKNQKSPGTDATNATNGPVVAFVASLPETFANSQGDSEPEVEAANDAALDPNRWCWPASSAMNSGEIDATLGRIARFTDRGLTMDEAERLADKLVLRDREQDDRRTCVECRHLHGAFAWRCGNWSVAGITVQASDAAIGYDFGLLLQRCSGFIQIIED